MIKKVKYFKLTKLIVQKPASILVTGRSKGFYREYLNFFECELSIEGSH